MAADLGAVADFGVVEEVEAVEVAVGVAEEVEAAVEAVDFIATLHASVVI